MSTSRPLSDPGTTQPPAVVDSALSGVVVAAIPAALAYFVGWAYLHYYLSEFGIGVSELELGVESIFIYAAPPAFWAVRSVGWIVLLIFVLGALAWRYWGRYFPSVGRLQSLSQNVHLAFKGVASFALLIVLAMAAAPLIKRVAVERADEKWAREGVKIQTAVAKPEEESIQYLDYKSCMERRALDLIFADKNVSYLLCISEINGAAGAVYEVRRTEARLASVRSVRRNLAKNEVK